MSKKSWLEEDLEKDKEFLFSIDPSLKISYETLKMPSVDQKEKKIEKKHEKFEEKVKVKPKSESEKEKNTKIVPMTQKKKCRNFENCKETGDEEHKDKYYHLCTIKECKYKNNEVHINRFVHNCKKKGCKDSDPLHQLQFIHEKIEKDLKICSTPIGCENKNKNHFKEFKHICEDSKCNSKDKEHRSVFIHPCKDGEKCLKISDSKHTAKYIHPCKKGSNCNELLNLDHLIMFTHEKKIENDLLKWPKYWSNPNPPKIETIKGNHYQIVNLSSSNQEYIDVEKKFKQFLPNRTVKSVERVENYNLWILYSKKRENLEVYGKELQLFHGTDAKSIILISEYGFDCRHGSLNGKYGAGIYFSPDSSYSDGYAKGSGKMFLSRYAVGDSIVKQNTMGGIRKAEKNPTTGRDYDTIIYFNQKEYIGYDNNQAYPEYIVTYQ